MVRNLEISGYDAITRVVDACQIRIVHTREGLVAIEQSEEANANGPDVNGKAIIGHDAIGNQQFRCGVVDMTQQTRVRL